MSDFRGRGGRGGRGMRSRGGPPRGGPRGGSRGGYSGDRDGGRGGFSRGRGDGFSRGRGGPPPRHLSRDDSPPRKVPMMSRGYDSDRGRGPPVGRHVERYEDSYDRRPPPRSRESYPSPSRDTGRLIDRLSPPRSSLRDRDYGLSSRGSSDYPSSRGDYLTTRSYSPPRESGSYRDSYSSSLRELREDRRDSFSRPAVRDYPSARTAGDYGGERSRDFRDSPRDYGSSRDYPPHRGSDFRESLSGRGEFRDLPPRDRLPPRDFDDDHDLPPRGGGQVSAGRHDHQGRGHLDHRSGGHFEHRGDTLGHGGDRDYTSSRFSSRLDDRVTSRGPPSRDYPPSREYGGRGGGSRGSMRGGRDDRGGGRGGFMNGDQVDVVHCSSVEKEIMSDNWSHLLELDQAEQSEVTDGSSFPTDIRKTDWQSSTILNIMDVQDRHQRSVGCQR